MGLSLRNFGKKLWDQVNVFDGGKSWSNPNGDARPQPTGRPKTIWEQNAQAQQGNPLVQGNNGQPNQQGKTMIERAVEEDRKRKAAEAAQQAVTNRTNRDPVDAGIERSLVGLQQGLSGTADLISPGKGTNRWSKSLDERAKEIDKSVDPSNINKYKTAQAATDIATFAAGGAAGAGLKGATKGVPYAGKAVEWLTKPLASSERLATGGRGAQVTNNVIKAVSTPGNAVNVGANTALDVGSESGKGRDISAEQVAKSAAINAGLGIGVPAAGALVKPTKATGKLTAETASGHTVEITKAKVDRKGGNKAVVTLKDNQGKVLSEKEIATSDKEWRAAQQSETDKYTQPVLKKAVNAVKREALDPRNIQQRLDDFEYKQQKKAGTLKKGQRRLDPGQSLAVLRGEIENPGRAAKTRDRAMYDDGTGNQQSLESIIKFYGKEEGVKARNFEEYRQKKQEIERRAKGHTPSNDLPDEDLATYVARYEQTNPQAIAHNRVLRQAMLKNAEDRVNARIEAPESLERIKNYEYYTPIERVKADDIQLPKIEGGVRSGAKGIEKRGETTAGPTRSRLQQYLRENQSTEKSLAQQKYDLELRRRVDSGSLSDKGYKHITSAETARTHRLLDTQVKSLREDVDNWRKTAKAVASEKNKLSNSRTKNVKAAKQAEERIIKTMDSMLQKAKQNSEEVLTDVVRGPEYKAQLADIKAQKLPNLTKAERQAQIKQDIKDLNSQYPSGYTRSEKLQLARAVSRVDAELDKNIATASAAKGLSEQQASDLLHLKDALTQARQTVRDTKAERSAAYDEWRDTTQYTGRNTQVHKYKLDGEVGEIEIPNNLARELQAANEAMKKGNLEKVVQGLSDIQKLTWTGVLAPGFKIWNVLVKNPILMFRNADGLSGVDPRNLGVVMGQIFRTSKATKQIEKFRENNISYENALQTRNLLTSTADDIAARTNVATFFARNPVSTMGDLWKGINQAFASLDNAQRTMVAQGAYRKALKNNYSVEEAYKIGANAPGQVFGDFDRISKTARFMEIIIPYSGSIQAGGRALGRATREKPIETTTKDALIIGAMASFAYNNFSNEGTRQYYEDMRAQGKEYELDNNWTITLPGMSPYKDEAGNWHNLIQVPLTPDFRAMMRGVNKTVEDSIKQNSFQMDPGFIAEQVGNFFTGDLKNSLYDPKLVKDGNVINGVLPGTPIGDFGKTITDVNVRTGDPLSSEYQRDVLAREDRYDKGFTSEGAINASKATGGLLTPQQYDQLYSKMGVVGKVLQGKGKGEVTKSIVSPVQPGKSMKDKSEKGKQYYEDLDAVARESGMDKRTYQEWKTLHTKDENKGKLNSAEKYLAMFDNKRLYDAEKALDQKSRDRGEPGNPLYDLDDDQVRRVLAYRSGKLYNSTKQNRTKDGETAFVSFGLDQPWYEDFRQAETAFYDAVSEKNPDQNDSVANTFSGQGIPEAGAGLQAKLDQYNAMPKGKDKSAFLKANPDITDFWNKQADQVNNERAALGMKPIDNSYGGGSGSSGSSGGGGGYRGNSGGYRNSKGDLTPEQVTGAPPNYKGAAGLRNPYALQVKAPKAKPKKTKVKVSLKKAKGTRLKSSRRKPQVRRKLVAKKAKI